MPANGKSSGILGDAYGWCQQCGFRYWLSEIRLRWDGLQVCPEDWEERPIEVSEVLPKEEIALSDPAPNAGQNSVIDPITWDTWNGYWEFQSIPWDKMNK